MQAYSEERPTELNEIYPQVHAYRIATVQIYITNNYWIPNTACIKESLDYLFEGSPSQGLLLLQKKKPESTSRFFNIQSFKDSSSSNWQIKM